MVARTLVRGCERTRAMTNAGAMDGRPAAGGQATGARPPGDTLSLPVHPFLIQKKYVQKFRFGDRHRG